MAITDYLQGIDRYTAGPKADVSNAAKDLATLQEGQGSLPAKLKEALNTKLNNNKDIINQQADTMQTYFNSGAVAREKYQDVFNPFEKAKLVQQERSMALRPYDVLSGVLENRMGQVSDIVDSGIQGWQGLVNAASTKAELAKSNLSTALQSYMNAASQQQAADQLAYQIAQAQEASRQFGITSGQSQQQINNQVDQFNREFGLKQKTVGGRDGLISLNDIYSLLNIIAPTEQVSEQSEPQPTNVPRNRAIQYHSPQGQWVYNWNYNAWVPSDAEVID